MHHPKKELGIVLTTLRRTREPQRRGCEVIVSSHKLKQSGRLTRDRLDTDSEQLEQAFRVNTLGLFHCGREAVADMRAGPKEAEHYER